MNNQTYLEILLKGLSTPFSQEESPHSLRPITALAWNGRAAANFVGGKLSLEGNLFADYTGLTTGDWEKEQAFVADLCDQLPTAGKFTYFYLAQAWASRRATATDEYVTLFDDNRLAAAQQVCDLVEPQSYLYVKGAINGIQRFIYDNIKAEQIGEAQKVSRRLRGRSFLVAILGEIIAEHLVLDKLGLEKANILFIGGGHFNLLIPTRSSKDLDHHLWKINKGLLEEFGLSLSVTLGKEPVTTLPYFSETFTRANDQLARRKHLRYAGYLSEVFFEDVGTVLAPESKDNYVATAAVEDAQEVGRWLPKARFLLEVSWPNKPQDFPQNNVSCLHLEVLHKSLFFLRRPQDEPNTTDDWGWLNHQMNSASWDWLPDHSYQLYRLNDTDFIPPAALQAAFLKRPLGYGYRFLGQYAPTKGGLVEKAEEQDHIMELTDLAQQTCKEGELLKFDRIAAMRLDIDDLGATFAHGLGAQADIRRTFALSRELQHFFGGYFNSLARKHQIYVVYSGGDDAFVLGSWWNVLYFARKLHEDFGRFTQQNPQLSLSAGIVLNHPNYPIARLAKDAGEEEGEAKKFVVDDVNVKNAIRVFGHTLSWERFVEMMAFAEELLREVEGGDSGLRRSVLQHLLSVISAAERAREQQTDDFLFYRQLGRLHALVTRRKVKKENKVVDKLLQDMADFSRFRDYVLPFHYVLYKTR